MCSVFLVSYFLALSLEEGEEALVNTGQFPFRFPPNAGGDKDSANVRSLIEAYSPATPSDFKTAKTTKDIKSVVEENSEGKQADTSKPSESPAVFEEIDLNSEKYSTLEALESLGLAHLKAELGRRGMKVGGTLRERAERLFVLRQGISNSISLGPTAEGKILKKRPREI